MPPSRARQWEVCICVLPHKPSRDPGGQTSLLLWDRCSSAAAAAAAKSLQSCPTLCDPIDGSPSGSPVPGILQARILEWVPISFSNAWKWKLTVKSLSRVRLLVTPWTVAHQAPPSLGFSRQEYWSGVPLPSPMQLYPPRTSDSNIWPKSWVFSTGLHSHNLKIFGVK